MKNKIYFFLTLSSLFILSSCSSVKVLNSWKADNASTLKTKNTIVIARTNNHEARVALETEIAKKLRTMGIEATESYKRIPNLEPNKKYTEEEIKEVKNLLREAGFNGVVLSVIKDKKLTVYRKKEGGYYAGATYAGYYPMYYSGFYGYYAHPNTYMNYGGNYVPANIKTQESITYVLETLAYNLDEPKDKQMVAVVTSSIEDPENATQLAKAYANKIANSLK
jgi:uncharacterized protein (UPF0335 family)